MSWQQLIESIDWQWLIGSIAFEFLLLWIKWAENSPIQRDPEPRLDCIARGGRDAWVVSAGRVRHP